MRILVVSAFEASSQWAHAINTVKMAEGFAKLGHQVILICRQPLEGKVQLEKLNKIYGLAATFSWIQLPRKILFRDIGEHWNFALLALPFILRSRPDLVYARNYIFPWVSTQLKIPTIAESHAHPDNKTSPFMRLVSASKHKSFRLWVTISYYLANHYVSLGVPSAKLLVLPDGVDIHLFKRPSKLPQSPYAGTRPNVVYVGHLYDYKGIPTILKAAGLLPDVEFHFIGGWPEDIERQQKRAHELGLKNVTFHGMKPREELPPFLWHADLLLLPPSQHHPSALWTSPLKLGEYFASGTPVVATDIPALRSWITDEEVEFVTPDDPQALAQGIKRILKDDERARCLSKAAWLKVQEWSYELRAKRILERIQTTKAAN